MSARSERSVAKRRIESQRTASSRKPQVQSAEWKLADESLDEALRQTFPASDALSMIQNVRGS
jgi:hypothetical protein